MNELQAHRSASPPLDSVTADVLAEGNSTSWAARNPGLPIIPPHQPLTSAEKAQINVHAAERKATAGSHQEKEASLNDTVKKLLEDMKKRVDTIATEHEVMPDKVQKLLGGYQFYKPSRSATLWNALLHAKATEVNAAGEKHTPVEIRQMVKDDAGMQDLSEEAQEIYIHALEEHRALKNMGVRANNTAAAKDVQNTLDVVLRLATWFGTDNVMDFWEDIMKWEPDAIARKLEQWACSFGQNMEEQNSLENMQKTCARLINSGLGAMTKKQNIRMNFVNFDVTIKSKLGIDLMGWPADAKFQSPFNMTNIEHVRSLRDALKSGTCRWVHMSPQERREHADALQAHRASGEIVNKPHKKRSDAGVPRKHKQVAGKENQSSKRKRASKGQGPRNRDFYEDEEVIDSDEDNSADK
ncbi:hypothetical protein HYDPIDRAFT_33466 [Hydnomerulius pinastri MD-312]|uniref:Uncharacterized protein n=1 Tax=Hydnomerulius pinastri MD-312 TaxID=994086 RepID=A0A0C9V1U5_9AGAM|nr:hypothetical protein HYDPIDRAFT_33466 [Hydnomerulius pinastri MD-312]